MPAPRGRMVVIVINLQCEYFATFDAAAVQPLIPLGRVVIPFGVCAVAVLISIPQLNAGITLVHDPIVIRYTTHVIDEEFELPVHGVGLADERAHDGDIHKQVGRVDGPGSRCGGHREHESLERELVEVAS